MSDECPASKQVGVTMRTTTIAAIALLLVSQVAYGSPETTLKRQYNKAIKQAVSKHETQTLLWVGNGLLNGYVFTEDAAGIRYFVSVEKDLSMAAQYFTTAVDRGDRVAGVLLGIMNRQGLGMPKNLERAAELLKQNKTGFYNAEGEYGLVLHEQLRNESIAVDRKEAITHDMIQSLVVAERAGYLPAINALSQIYEEGKFTESDARYSAQLRERSKSIAEQKIRLNSAIADAQQRMTTYRKAAKKSQWTFDALLFLATVGAIGSVSLANSAGSCAVGCSPPSVVDLMNWGVL